MNDDPKEVHILYGLVQEETSPPGLLQTIADSIVDHFDKAGEYYLWLNKSLVKI